MRSLNLVLFLCALSLVLTINGCKKTEEIEEDAAVTEPDAAPAVDQEVVKPDTKAPAPDLGKPDTKRPSTGDLKPSFDAWKKCQIEVNLATKQPCDCYGTQVYDVVAQYPECVAPKIVKCCPAIQGPKCE